MRTGYLIILNFIKIVICHNFLEAYFFETQDNIVVCFYYDYNKLNEKHDAITGKEGFE